MAREFPSVPFERYVDDVVVHCVSETQAQQVLAAIAGGCARSGCGCTRTRPGSCTARTASGVARMSTPRSLPGVHIPAARARTKDGKHVLVVPARDQQGRPERRSAREVRSWRLHHRTHLTERTSHDRSTRSCGVGCTTTARSTGRRCIPSWAHQRLPDALDPQEIQTAAGRKKAQPRGPRPSQTDHGTSPTGPG